MLGLALCERMAPQNAGSGKARENGRAAGSRASQNSRCICRANTEGSAFANVSRGYGRSRRRCFAPGHAAAKLLIFSRMDDQREPSERSKHFVADTAP